MLQSKANVIIGHLCASTHFATSSTAVLSKLATMRARSYVLRLLLQVGRKIFLQKDRRSVVLCVVDVWDFDGSLPRSAIKWVQLGAGGSRGRGLARVGQEGD